MPNMTEYQASFLLKQGMTPKEFTDKCIPICKVIGWPEFVKDGVLFRMQYAKVYDDFGRYIKKPTGVWHRVTTYLLEEAANHHASHLRKKLVEEGCEVVINQDVCFVRKRITALGECIARSESEYTALIQAAEELWMGEKG